MRRILSNPLTALLTGACLRLFFVLKFPAGSGDTVIYEQLAANWLKYGRYAMDIGGQPVPVDLRMPGYPAFLTTLYALTGRAGENARLVVMLAQVLVDLASCLLIAVLAAQLVRLYANQAKSKRVFTSALWLAALCPLTANYVAVPLTEVWAIFFTALALILFVLLASLITLGPHPAVDSVTPKRWQSYHHRRFRRDRYRPRHSLPARNATSSRHLHFLAYLLDVASSSIQPLVARLPGDGIYLCFAATPLDHSQCNNLS